MFEVVETVVPAYYVAYTNCSYVDDESVAVTDIPANNVSCDWAENFYSDNVKSTGQNAIANGQSIMTIIERYSPMTRKGWNS